MCLFILHFDVSDKLCVLIWPVPEVCLLVEFVYKLRKTIGLNDFPYHFEKIIVRYKKIGYNIDALRQIACLVVNPIKVYNFAYLFDCTTGLRQNDGIILNLI